MHCMWMSQITLLLVITKAWGSPRHPSLAKWREKKAYMLTVTGAEVSTREGLSSIQSNSSLVREGDTPMQVSAQRVNKNNYHPASGHPESGRGNTMGRLFLSLGTGEEHSGTESVDEVAVVRTSALLWFFRGKWNILSTCSRSDGLHKPGLPLWHSLDQRRLCNSFLSTMTATNFISSFTSMCFTFWEGEGHCVRILSQLLEENRYNTWIIFSNRLCSQIMFERNVWNT